MGRKAKIYEPINEIPEKHPWLRFPKQNNNSVNLIIGSFPPNKFTNHPEKQTLCDMDFFYGSKENAFWELFVGAKKLNLKLPNDLKNLKKWIEINKWTVTDLINCAQRKKDTAYDSDLINIEWNIETIKSILENPIENIYFTSKWVKDKFDLHVRVHLNNMEKINEYVLLSPSRNGLRKAKVAKFTTHKPYENETAESHRLRYYRIVLNNTTTTNSDKGFGQ